MASSATEATKESKIGTKVASLGGEDEASTSNTYKVQRKRTMPHTMLKNTLSLTLGADQ